MACLSAALSYAVESKHVATNVAKELRRPRKTVRQRLITDAEFLEVFAVAGASVRLAMVLAVRTLGLPADILAMGPRNIKRQRDGRRTLAFRRGKTGIAVEIEIVGELAIALEPFLADPSLHPSFIRTPEGLPYTVDGIGAMFRRHCLAAKVPDFGLRDLRAKGATDMYRSSPPTPIRQIQRLLGHKSAQTTEIYLKSLITEVVRPNEVPILAAVNRPCGVTTTQSVI